MEYTRCNLWGVDSTIVRYPCTIEGYFSEGNCRLKPAHITAMVEIVLASNARSLLTNASRTSKHDSYY